MYLCTRKPFYKQKDKAMDDYPADNSKPVGVRF